MTRRETVGSGIVRKTREHLNFNSADEAEVAEAFRRLGNSWRWETTLGPWINWIAARVETTKACPGHGDPRCCGLWKCPHDEGWPNCHGGNWRELDDLEWYIRDVDQRIAFLRNAVERQDANAAGQAGIELGAAVLQLQLKIGPEADWLWGRDKKAGAQRGGLASRGLGSDEERCASVDDLKVRKPHLSWTACYKAIAPKFKVTARTIKESCQNHRKADIR